jgi:PAS domain S-box-containing protein
MNTKSATSIKTTFFEINFTHLRLFVWGSAIVALLPFWGWSFFEPPNVYVELMYSAWVTFVIFVMALGTTFYLQRHIDTGVLLERLQMQAQKEAHLRLEQLNALLLMSPEGIVAFDAQQKVQFVNPAFVRISGLSDLQLHGLSYDHFTDLMMSRCIPPAVFPSIDKLRQSIMRQRIELADNGKLVLQVELVSASSVFDDLEVPLSMLLYFRDITQESQLEKDKTDFLATAAHELRTPMASVYGFAEVLLLQENDAVAQREYLNIIYRQSQHMVKIINDLLDLARIESRKSQDLVFTRVLVQDVVKDAVMHFMPPQGREAPILVLPLDSVYIKVDQSKINQALQNVLSNAYKFSPSGGEVQIKVKPHSDRHVYISVKDTGIGMTEKQTEMIFNRFFRAESAANVPGTGLGMNIVKEIMKLHMGDVLIDSALDVGTRVSLILPVCSE